MKQLIKKVVDLIITMFKEYDGMDETDTQAVNELATTYANLFIKIISKSVKPQKVAKVETVKETKATKEDKEPKAQALYVREYIEPTKKHAKGLKFNITLKSLTNQLTGKALTIKKGDTVSTLTLEQVIALLDSGKSFVCVSNKSKYSLIKNDKVVTANE